MFTGLLLLTFLKILLGSCHIASADNAPQYVCKTYGSGVFKPFNGSAFYVRTSCPATLTQFTHRRVMCLISILRGDTGLMTRVEIVVNNIRTIIQNGTISVETRSVSLPYDHTYQHIFQYGIYTKLKSKVLPLSITWYNAGGGISSIWVILNEQLVSEMAGFCGRLDSAANPQQLIPHSILSDETCVIRDSPQPLPTIAVCRDFMSQAVQCLQSKLKMHLQLCENNAFGYRNSTSITCAFFKEIALQCGPNSSLWRQWRRITGCSEPKCPANFTYQELGNAFQPTCSNPTTRITSEDLVSTCSCPNGKVLNDHAEDNHCLNVTACPCVHGSKSYTPGAHRQTKCQKCLCMSGKWQCSKNMCLRKCVIESQFVTSFDGRQYSLPRKCTYVAAQGANWTLSIHFSERAVSIKQLDLNIFQEKYVFSDSSLVFGTEEINDFHQTELVTAFWQSSIYVQVQTFFGMNIQVRMLPEIQMYVSLPQSEKGKTQGLCGNYNDDSTDDFTTSSGIIENSAEQFALSWAMDGCGGNISKVCINLDNEFFADEKCFKLRDPNGLFSECHDHVPLDPYIQACIMKTCQCTTGLQSCLCVALGNYAKACANQGITLGDWRASTNCTLTCEANQVFNYNTQACNETCRSLSGLDPTCVGETDPVEGCGCPKGTHLQNQGSRRICSPRSLCHCHYPGGTTPPGPSVVDGRPCNCEDGRLNCSEDCGCSGGKVCVHCSYLSANTTLRTCESLSRPVVIPDICESGCYCPDGLYEDHRGECVPVQNCTCVFAGKVYGPGQTVESNCKTCICNEGYWICSGEPCQGKCQLYGNGHYQTFDSKWYHFDGNCQYTLVEDDCGSGIGMFTVKVESIPCCDEALICSRTITVDLPMNNSLILSDMRVQTRHHSDLMEVEPMYYVHTVGLYIIVSIPRIGLTLIWDKHTRVTVHLEAKWRGKVCGLCGNFDASETNDLLSRGSSMVSSTLEFANSWKSPTLPCSDQIDQSFPCQRHSYCANWAERRCMILRSDTFRDCHLKVDPEPYYQACVLESCSCEFEGKFLGFCTAVAAYAEACSEQNVCIKWRTPDLCPVYCDFYNEEGQYSWHYEPCGHVKACLQRKGFSSKLEGCYPRCPKEAPYYDENTKRCTTQESCTCLFNYAAVKNGTEIRTNNTKCICMQGIIFCDPPLTTPSPAFTVGKPASTTPSSFAFESITTSSHTTPANAPTGVITTTLEPTTHPTTMRTIEPSTRHITTTVKPTKATVTTATILGTTKTSASSLNSEPTTTVPPTLLTTKGTKREISTTTESTTYGPLTTTMIPTTTPFSTTTFTAPTTNAVSLLHTNITGSTKVTPSTTESTTIVSLPSTTAMEPTMSTESIITTTNTVSSHPLMTQTSESTDATEIYTLETEATTSFKSATLSTTTAMESPTNTPLTTATATTVLITNSYSDMTNSPEWTDMTEITDSEATFSTMEPPESTTSSYMTSITPATATATESTVSTSTSAPITTANITVTPESTDITEIYPTDTEATISTAATTEPTKSTMYSYSSIPPSTTAKPMTEPTTTESTTNVALPTATAMEPTMYTTSTTSSNNLSSPTIMTQPPERSNMTEIYTTDTESSVSTLPTTTSTTSSYTPMTSTNAEKLTTITESTTNGPLPTATAVEPTMSSDTATNAYTAVSSSLQSTAESNTSSYTTLAKTTAQESITSFYTTETENTASSSAITSTESTSRILTTKTAGSTKPTTATVVQASTITKPTTTLTMEPTDKTSSEQNTFTAATSYPVASSTTMTTTMSANTTTEAPTTKWILTKEPKTSNTINPMGQISTYEALTHRLGASTASSTATSTEQTTINVASDSTSIVKSSLTSSAAAKSTTDGTTTHANPNKTTAWVSKAVPFNTIATSNHSISESSTESTTFTGEPRTVPTDKTQVPSTPKTTQVVTHTAVPKTTAMVATITTEPTPSACECKDLQRNQSWTCGMEWTEDCFHKICRDGKIEMTTVSCPEMQLPDCPRGQIRKISDGCCETMQCDCRCDVYGDPHYISFQGTSFDFLDNCTYVLVKEDMPRHNFSIVVDNYFCIPELDGSCIKGITLKYHNNTITLTIVESEFNVAATLNGATLQLPYEEQGIRFETTGVSVSVYFREIRSEVSLTPFNTLVITLALEHFQGNTLGQCGVCGGSSCVRPNGQTEDESCCDKTAYDWIHDDPLKPYCKEAQRNVPCHTDNPVTPVPPCATPVCDLLKHPVFQQCRDILDFDILERNCKYDVCLSKSHYMACSTLQQAVEQCKQAGICVEWRHLTNGTCTIQCPPGLLYSECRGKLDDFCNGGVMVPGRVKEDLKAGCFCPDNQIRAEEHKDICVNECTNCKGPWGEPKELGETWESNCQLCTCNNYTRSVECRPNDPVPAPTCRPNFVLVPGCCNNPMCVERTCQHNGLTFKVQERWTDASDPCLSFSCTTNGTEMHKRECPQQSCHEDRRVWDKDHCCFSCNNTCSPELAEVNVTVDNCTGLVKLPVCAGECRALSRWTHTAGFLQQEIYYCQEKSSEQRLVSLMCVGNVKRSYTYRHITACQCKAYTTQT
ncbi:mucin-2 isoform X2 [Denticeps clupeoides]|uniref:mucin-2 isoform X2 n=1 Tax=Denticeps clupeoides TaxID=299321 RepID=UPI0010A2FE0F|nr:mucin-2-like isoform X2 [Denticeps clupeoides]